MSNFLRNLGHSLDPRQIADQVNHAVEGFANQMRNGIQQAANDARNGITQTANQAISAGKNALQQVVNQGEATLKSTASDGVEKVENAGHVIIAKAGGVRSQIETAGQAELTKLEDGAEHAVDAALMAIRKAAVSKVGQTALKVIKGAQPQNVFVRIGPFELSWNDITGREDAIAGYIQNPPSTSRADVQGVIKALAPDMVAVDLEIGLSEIVVQTDDLSLELRFEWSMEQFIAEYDTIADAVGLS